jgi:glycerol-3-phosphate cytidylyltransferase
MKKTITYGTFDMFHVGHLNLIKRLKNTCDFLIIAVSSDEFNLKKGKKTVIPFEQRVEIIESIKYVDMVIKENDWDQKILDIKEYNVDTFAIGDDWKGEFDFLKDYCEVIYLPRTEGISTTSLKKHISSKF